MRGKLGIGLVVLGIGCSGSDDPGLSGSAAGADAGRDVAFEAALICDPGQQVGCPCPGSSDGAQRCRDDGSGWEPCECVDASAWPPEAGDDADALPPTDATQDAPTDATSTPDADADTCPPAPCIPSGELGWNCDPACGAVAPECSAMCDPMGPAIELDYGTYYLRTGPLHDQHCCGAGEAWETWKFILPEQVCGSIVGPYGLAFDATGYTPPDGCVLSETQGFGTFNVTGGNPPFTSFLVLSHQREHNGAIIRIDVAQPGNCPPWPMSGGCNGGIQL